MISCFQISMCKATQHVIKQMYFYFLDIFIHWKIYHMCPCKSIYREWKLSNLHVNRYSYSGSFFWQIFDILVVGPIELDQEHGWGHSAAYALVTSVTLVKTSNMVVIRSAWVHPGSQGNMAPGLQWRKPPTQSPNFVDNWHVFAIENSHPQKITFWKLLFRLQSLQNYSLI